MNPISLLERNTKSTRLFCSYSKIPKEAVGKEVNMAKIILERGGFSCEYLIREEEALDPGCSLLVFSHDKSSVTGSDAIYQGKMEGIGESVAKKFIQSDLGADLCLSDMLVVPLSLINETSIYRIKQI